MKNRMKPWAVLQILLMLGHSAGAIAAPPGAVSIGSDLGSVGAGNEFVSGNYPGAILMPINLWGSVGKPGIHHVPTQTDLITLLSLAGGPGPDAQLDKITIKRRAGKEEQILKVDAEEYLNKAGMRSPVLEANDIVVIPRDTPPISSNTVTTVTFVGSVLGIILAGFALSRQTK